MSVTRRVGVIGLGNIGSSIGMHLANKGFEVTGFDVRPEGGQQLAADGGTPLGSAAEVAAAADVIITSLPSVKALYDVLAEVSGELSGKVLIETSTLPLEVKHDAHRIVTEAGGQIVDCPLSGTAMQAKKGDVVAYASADEGVVESVRDVLDGFNRKTYELGAYGQGSKMKFLANLLVAVHNVSTAEALVLAKRAGMDMSEAVEVLSDGAGGSRMLEVRGPMMAEDTYGEPGMNVGVFMKDVAIITDYARELGVPTPLLQATVPVYSAALAHGWGSSDTASVFAVLADMANLDRTPVPQEEGK